MLRNSQTAAAAGAIALLIAGAADAKTCRDAAGHFMACPKAAPAASAAVNTSARAGMAATAQSRCRDAKGHFVSCAAVVAPAPPAAAPAARPSVLSRLAPRPAPRAATGTAAPTTAVVPAPAAAGAATARCRDGSLSYSRHRSGTCAGHAGVAAWL